MKEEGKHWLTNLTMMINLFIIIVKLVNLYRLSGCLKYFVIGETRSRMKSTDAVNRRNLIYIWVYNRNRHNPAIIAVGAITIITQHYTSRYILAKTKE